MSAPEFWTIRADIPFVDALAAGLLADYADDHLSLGSITILLPTRRACLALSQAFLRQSSGQALLLPRLTPIGESDETQSLMTLEDEPGLPEMLDIAPAIPGLQRRLALARLILNQINIIGEENLSPAHAIRLADSLASLLDQVQTERLSLDDLQQLVPDDYAVHWQLTLEFLKILTESWPDVAEALGCIDPAARRNLVIDAQAAAWLSYPPKHAVIAAGSTGSVPATADLLDIVARLPHGKIILPGFDSSLTEKDLEVIEPTHPQFGMARLLRRCGVKPNAVKIWSSDLSPSCCPARVQLISRALQSPNVTQELPKIDISSALEGVRLIDCPGPHEEAGVIALALRRALEKPGRTAALVTPDRALARRVAVELGRWNIAIDDSAGEPLSNTPVGTFLRLLASCIAERLAPVSLLALLKHPMARAGFAAGEFKSRVRQLELLALRGPRPTNGFAGLWAALENTAVSQELREWLTKIEVAATPLANLLGADGTVSVKELVAAHIVFAETLAATETSSGSERLWAGEDGEAAAAFFAELQDSVSIAPTISGCDYTAYFESLMVGHMVRPRYGMHPRLHIWGLLEARLQHVDLICLGGLNEGTWPAEPSADPWMSRMMRRTFGLPPPERRVGLNAHDFSQAFCVEEVLMTRAVRVDGTPTVPARWLLRLENTLVALAGEGARSVLSSYNEQANWLGWQWALDTSSSIIPIPPPAPTPPISARPRRISVTQVETWMRDPYSIYARHVLGLKPLDPIDADPGAAERGTIIHAALDAFLRAHTSEFEPNALPALVAAGEMAFGETLARPGVWGFWWPRFLRIAAWFVKTEGARRADIEISLTEVEGILPIDAPGGQFELVAKADRIDLLSNGSLSIIDYKTGSLPRAHDIVHGFAPQLPLEAFMAMAGAFCGIPALPVSQLEFWRLTGGEPAGERRSAGQDIEALARSAEQGIRALVAEFDNPATAYLSRPDPFYSAAYAEYNHLARVQEWSSVGTVDFEV